MEIRKSRLNINIRKIPVNQEGFAAMHHTNRERETCVPYIVGVGSPISFQEAKSFSYTPHITGVTIHTLPSLQNCMKDSPLQTILQQLISNSAFFPNCPLLSSPLQSSLFAPAYMCGWVGGWGWGVGVCVCVRNIMGCFFVVVFFLGGG